MAYISPLESQYAKIFGSFCLGIFLLMRLFSSLTGIPLRASSFLGFLGTIVAIGVLSAGATWLVLRLLPDGE
jgi:hypothetical protein